MRNVMVEAVAVELAEHFEELSECGEGIGTGSPGIGFVECAIDQVGKVAGGSDRRTAAFTVLIGGLWYEVQVTEQEEDGSQ
jgi:hypothetical protein